MEDEPIDFSSLDPRRDARRFEAMVARVLSGVTSRPPVSILSDLVRRGRVAMIATTLIALVAWLPTLSENGHLVGETTLASTDPVVVLWTWAHLGGVPADADPWQALGGTPYAQ